MNAFVPRDTWIEEFKEWLITDCAVRSQTILYIVARQDIPDEEASTMWDHDIHTKLYVIYLHRDAGECVGWQELDGFNKPRCGVSQKPLSQGMVIARNNDGDVFVAGGGRKGQMEHIDPGKLPFTARVKCINGYAYSVGYKRKIYKRVNIGEWVLVAQLSGPDEDVEMVGFSDMDAFSEDDMYAVGGGGDVWHFDGKRWMQMGFPSNVELGTVTCAGDGKVYISGEGGSLWCGRESTWEPIYKGSSSILWNDAVWFEDKLWLASDYQLRVLEGKKLVEVKHNGELVPIYGHMDARDGLLIVASPDAVMGYDGKEWRIIVAPYL